MVELVLSEPRYVHVLRWLAGPFIILSLALMVFRLRLLPWPALAVGITALPSTFALDLPNSRHARTYALRAAVIGFSSIGIGAILISQHSAFPGWFTTGAIIYVLLGTPALVWDLALTFRRDLRQELNERRTRRLSRS